jgi:hypothetical protein
MSRVQAVATPHALTFSDMSATLLAVQTPILQTLNNLVSQSLETMQQLARPPMPEASSQKERLEVPPRFGAGREAHEFRAIMSHYSHVSWDGFVFEDFCEQTQAEFDVMISDPSANVSLPHKLALRRLFKTRQV